VLFLRYKTYKNRNQKTYSLLRPIYVYRRYVYYSRLYYACDSVIIESTRCNMVHC